MGGGVGVGVSGGNMGRLPGDERETRLVDEEGTFDDVPEGRRHLQLETSSLERKQPLNQLQKEVVIVNSLARQLAKHKTWHRGLLQTRGEIFQ